MRKWIPLLIIAAAFIASAAVWSGLPDTMPTHWNLAGDVDGWSGKAFGAWMLPLVLAGLWLLLRFLPRIDPRRANYAKFGPTYEAIIVTVMLFLFCLHAVALRTALGIPVPMDRLVPLGAGVMMIVIGNLLPRARPNWFVGIRTPWTLSSDRVWERTHRVGGRLLVVGGIVVVLAALFAAQLAQRIMIGTLVAESIAVVAYSYIEWHRLNSGDPAKPTQPT
ncbi:MAG TPA: SdpI family protein [Gemmatimonadaceae bacterium]|nr:SdpI family protein [Gemmatimonadaceae bacterium]